MSTKPRRALLCVLALTLGCGTRKNQPADAPPAAPSSRVARPAAWDALCPASGASEPAVFRVAQKDIRFEPSAAAVWDGRVAVFSDKQAVVWWWTPGSPDVTTDPAWAFSLSGSPSPDACCSATPGDWGTATKRQKAAETCADHNVALGNRVPWLKAEGGSSVEGGLFMVGNMGFGCRDNSGVLRFPQPGATPESVPGVDRDRVLAALSARDVRVEGFAVTPDGKTALVAIREKDEVLSHTVLVAEGFGSAAVTLRSVVVQAPPDATAEETGLSDVTVLSDGRVAVTVSKELHEGSKRMVAGELWVSSEAAPYRAGATWTTVKAARFPDHKPEVVVQLGPHCAAVMFDDDDGYKAQFRDTQPDGRWDPASAFVSYVRLP